MSKPNLYNDIYDIDRLVQEARLERSAAIGRALVNSADWIGAAVKSALGFDRPQAPVMSSRAALKLSSLANER